MKLKLASTSLRLLTGFLLTGFLRIWTVAYLCEEGYDCDKIVRPKLKYYNPSTPGWKAINDRRFKQLASSISDEDDKYSFYSVRYIILKSKPTHIKTFPFPPCHSYTCVN